MIVNNPMIITHEGVMHTFNTINQMQEWADEHCGDVAYSFTDSFSLKKRLDDLYEDSDKLNSLIDILKEATKDRS